MISAVVRRTRGTTRTELKIEVLVESDGDS